MSVCGVWVSMWRDSLKTGYIEFAWLETYADATPAVMLSPAVALAAEVHSLLPRREPSRY